MLRLALSDYIDRIVDGRGLRQRVITQPRPFADISKSKQTETAETRSTAAQLRKSFCHRKGIEPTFREGSPRSCAKMWQSEIESRLGRIGVQHEPSR